MDSSNFREHISQLMQNSNRKEGTQNCPLIIINVRWESLGQDNRQRLWKGRALKAMQDSLARYPGLFNIAVCMTDEELRRTRDMANVFCSGIRRIVEKIS
ncbi:MAG: hypothetical protein Greene041662_991 [Candidatus Peregrinibacteria bacterium Greene0416_62]|nr:MAG: hypothetical protein Greene041662_991 [Candidatus Peregrinibacteria bacterium Greene0416_62]TSD00499.1 MAG: hypothetical protein Greene101449_109 [Candidatus Peregrinibacteria bacterium Greene1014_49]